MGGGLRAVLVLPIRGNIEIERFAVTSPHVIITPVFLYEALVLRTEAIDGAENFTLLPDQLKIVLAGEDNGRLNGQAGYHPECRCLQP